MRQMIEQSLGDNGNKINMNGGGVNFGKQTLLPEKGRREEREGNINKARSEKVGVNNIHRVSKE